MLVALTDGEDSSLGVVVRALSKQAPWSSDAEGKLWIVGPKLGLLVNMPQVLTIRELDSLPVGSRVLIHASFGELDWLNHHRPLLAERQLRVVLWLDGPLTFDYLVRHALDLASWISLDVPVPRPGLPEFTRAGLRAALAAGLAFCWRDGRVQLRELELDEPCIELQARTPLLALLAQLREPGLPIVYGIDSQPTAWRIRLALALVGRDDRWIAVSPRVPLPGMPLVHAEPLEWATATERLAAAGWTQPALMAAWVELEPEAIDEACTRVDLPPRSPSEYELDPTLSTRVPSVALCDWLASPALAAAREQLVSGEQPGEEAGAVVWSRGRSPWSGSMSDAIEPRLARALRMLGDASPSAELVAAAHAIGFGELVVELAHRRWAAGEHDVGALLVAELVERGMSEQAAAIVEAWLERAGMDVREQVRARVWRARLALMRDELELACQELDTLEIAMLELDAHSLDERRTWVHALVERASAERRGGELERARVHAERALVGAELLVHEQLLVRVELLAIAIACRDEASALTHRDQAFELVFRLDTHPRPSVEEAVVAYQRGRLQAMVGYYGAAQERFIDAEAALEVQLERSDVSLRIMALLVELDHALLLLEGGALELALDHAATAARRGDALVALDPARVDLRRTTARAHALAGALHEALGQHGQARERDLRASALGWVEHPLPSLDLTRVARLRIEDREHGGWIAGGCVLARGDSHVLLTARHVVAGARWLRVELGELELELEPELIAHDDEEDWALLRLPVRPELDAYLLPLAPAGSIAPGTPLATLGRREAGEPFVQHGLLLSHRVLEVESFVPELSGTWVDFPQHGLWSGAPVLDARGVIGIVTDIWRRSPEQARLASIERVLARLAGL